ncbi:MAG TPA: histidine--tRNA ligase [Cytophagales bacterium]|nr:histidine--tRNA ligase [Cytophagales bacterium]
MKKIIPSLPKGTRDYSPDEMKKREYLFEVFKYNFNLYGFNCIETPSMENSEVLNGKYGEEGDRLIYRILNSGDFLKNINNKKNISSNNLKSEISKKGLRYDLTIPFARYVSMNRDKITMPFKRYQIQPVWRADRPQKGRFREFYQCDVDYIGTKSIVCESEIISLVYSIFKKLKIDDFEIKLNNRKILLGISEELNFKNKFEKFCVLIDKIDKIGVSGLKKEMKLSKFPTSSIKKLISLIELKGNNSSKINYVKTFLSNSKIGLEGINEIENLMKIKSDFTLDFTLARGLSYYTSTIFEVVPINNNIGSLCGGGRYDDLTEIFGYKNISGIGISFGIERIIEILNTNNLFPEKIEINNNVLISYLSNDLIKNSLELANKLREKGIPTDLYSEKAKLKKQLQYANNNNIPFVIIIGEDEIKNGKYMLKNMKDGNQNLLTINEIINKMSSIK